MRRSRKGALFLDVLYHKDIPELPCLHAMIWQETYPRILTRPGGHPLVKGSRIKAPTPSGTVVGTISGGIGFFRHQACHPGAERLRQELEKLHDKAWKDIEELYHGKQERLILLLINPAK